MLILFLLTCLGNSIVFCEDRNQLFFSYITTVTGGSRAIGGKPVIDLALEEINSRMDLLENYTLNYTAIHDSEVQYVFSRLCSRFFQVYFPPTV